MRRSVVAVVAVVLALMPMPGAAGAPAGCEDTLEPYTGGSPRVREIEIAQRRVLVLLPEGYERSGRRYPVVYLLHGSENIPDAFLVRTDLIEFTRALPDEEQAIVVLPDGGLEDWWVDWDDGRLQDETLFIREIVPAIDAAFRTRRGGSPRAIAGFSLGGYAAAQLAARHPDLFSAVATLSGAPFDLEHPGSLALTTLAPVIVSHCDGEPERTHPFALFGDPVAEPMSYHGASPVDLARNLHGMSVSLFAGTGTPCDEKDPPLAEPPRENPAWWIEAGVREQTDRFSAALRQAEVKHTYQLTSCGVHTYRYAEKDIHGWWPHMIASLDHPAPGSFDHRSADPEFSLWGWTFSADPQRAPEFLDVTKASDEGLTLTGSGRTSVTTASLFRPNQSVRLKGAIEQAVVSNEEGRITFHVDLGPAHSLERFTIEQRAREAFEPETYWKTAKVVFEDDRIDRV